MYTRPDVYIERNNSSNIGTGLDTLSIPVFVGITPLGIANEPILINSWTEFLNNFSYNIEPFSAKPTVMDSVYGYFLNGGTKLYFIKVTNSDSSKATGVKSETILSENVKKKATKSNAVFMSKGYNEIFNKLTISINAIEDEENMMVVAISLEDNLVERFEVSTDINHYRYFKPYINSKSKYVEIVVDTLEEGNYTFSGANENVSNISNKDYIKAINSAKEIESFDTLTVPYVTTSEIIKEVEKVALSKQALPIYSLPLNLGKEDLKDYIKSLPSNGGCFYPHINIQDTNSQLGTKKVDPTGHILGVYATSDSKYGLHKAPAGVEAVIKGAISLTEKLLDEDYEAINPLGVNCLKSMSNGIVVWGARTLSKNPKLRYISDVRLGNFIDKQCYKNTQWAVFEPNDEKLWERIISSHTEFMQSLYDLGMLKGSEPKEAYYIKCDEELNNEQTQADGLIISEIGYATKKPSEFVIVRITQKA